MFGKLNDKCCDKTTTALFCGNKSITSLTKGNVSSGTASLRYITEHKLSKDELLPKEMSGIPVYHSKNYYEKNGFFNTNTLHFQLLQNENGY